jgi:hypothetical protein
MTTPKERPILFTAEMVRAILAERKTQTRRLVRPTPVDLDELWPNDDSHIEWGDVVEKLDYYVGCGYCPYGKPGERLWVRETWQWVCEDKGGNRTTEPNVMKTYVGCWYEYAATSTEPPPKWRPSIFMPRKASRLTLEIVKVRVERLQDISEADVYAEGMTRPTFAIDTCFDEYRELWDKINGKRAPWASDPWVWCLEFKVLP